LSLSALIIASSQFGSLPRVGYDWFCFKVWLNSCLAVVLVDTLYHSNPIVKTKVFLPIEYGMEEAAQEIERASDHGVMVAMQ
jgi:hypothetical protein